MRRSRWSRPARLAAGIALAGVFAGCGGPEGEPVARLAVEPEVVELPYGAFVDLRLRWTPLAELEGRDASPRVFLHLLDPEGDLVRTFDHELGGSWRPGRELAYAARVYQSLLAPPLPPGTYSLSAGLYDPDGGERWSLESAGEEIGRSEYRVASVEVPSGRDDAARMPAVQFDAAWSPTVAGADRQVIALRWLSGEGTIRLEEVPSAGTLWLSIGVPREVPGSLRRRIVDPPEGGDGVPRVDLAASCSGFEAQVSGEGTHRIDVPVEPSDAGCEIALDPNFVVESPGAGRRTLVLEVLAWRASGT